MTVKWRIKQLSAHKSPFFDRDKIVPAEKRGEQRSGDEDVVPGKYRLSWAALDDGLKRAFILAYVSGFAGV